MGSLVSLAQGSVVVPATTVVGLLAMSWALAWGIGVATFIALYGGS